MNDAAKRGPLAQLWASVPGSKYLLGTRAVFRRELVGNLKSVRMAVVTGLMALLIIGGALGLNSVTSVPVTDIAMFPHAILPQGPNGTQEAVVFVSDAWGVPKPSVEVGIVDAADLPGGFRGGGINATVARTDGNGFARFSNLSGESYFVGRILGDGFQQLANLDFRAAAGQNISLWSFLFDLENKGAAEYLDLSAMNGSSGSPLAGAEVLREGAVVATLDARGFAQVKLPVGYSNITLRSGADEVTFSTFVTQGSPSLLSGGPDGILFIVAALFVVLIAPIGAIAIAHDAIARERTQGSIDLILSRPATRTGVLLGKFGGTTAAVVLPLWATLFAGALAISSVSGKTVTWSFLGAILGASALYVATFVLLVLIFSTVAKTTGTAIMFGFLVWILFFILWGVVVQLALLASGLDAADRGYYELQVWAILLNFNALYQGIVGISHPTSGENPFTFQGEEILPSWAPAAGALVWFFVLLVIALWVFNRKAAE